MRWLRLSFAQMLYLRLYLEGVRRAFRGIGKSPWTLALPLIYAAGFIAASILVSPLGGTVGGFILNIVFDMLTSSLLYFVAQTVQLTPSKPRELKESLLAFFWPVVSFGFIYWLASMVIAGALKEQPNGDKIGLAIYGVMLVLLNVVPEVIYQKTPADAGIGRGIGIITESIKFIQTHWIEWLIPNIVILVGLYELELLLARLPFGLFVMPLTGVLFYVVFVIRGCLFNLIDTTTPYQLKLRYGKK